MTNRRSLIKALAMVPFGACIPRAALTASSATDLASGLVIDAHTHIFNYRDIPGRNAAVRAFAKYPLSAPALYTVARAPRINSRGRASRAASANGCIPEEVVLRGYRSGSLREQFTADRQIPGRGRLPEGCSYDRSQDGPVAPFESYRSVNALKMIDLFPATDLFVSAHVSLFSGAGPAPENLASYEEGDVLRAITIGTGARVLHLAGFDPLEEVRDRSLASSTLRPTLLDRAKHAIERGYVLGFKLYPPMGYSLTDNSSRYCGIDPDSPKFTLARGKTLDKVRLDYGDQIDEVLGELFAWCEQNQAVVMAHSSYSNFVGGKRCGDSLGSPAEWEVVLERHPGLRLNLGHTGGGYDIRNRHWKQRAVDLFALIERHSHVFADLGYEDTFLSKGAQRRAAPHWLKALDQYPQLAERLMYGTDWHMMHGQGGRSEYFMRFKQVFSGNSAWQRQLLGTNAANFFGLRAGETPRERIDALLKVHEVDPPRWMRKLI